MRRLLYLLFFYCSTYYFLHAQAPLTQWQRCLGGSNSDNAEAIQPTTDGGFIVASETNSNDGDVSGFHGRSDLWITKLDKNGAIQWQKCLGGSREESLGSILTTPDEGFVLLGSTASNDGDVVGLHGGNSDSWVVKLDKNGAIQWQRCLGGLGGEASTSIALTPGGGYILVGTANYNDGDVSGLHGTQVNFDIWVVKLNDKGVMEWQRALGGSNDEFGYSVQATPDKGYIVAGTTSSNDGNVTGAHGSSDAWVVKLDETGAIKWQRTLGGSGIDAAHSVAVTADKGIIVAGYTESKDGDVKGQHGVGEDGWVVKLDSAGNLKWQRALGGSSREILYSVQTVAKTGYIVTGFTASDDGDVKATRHGSFIIPDLWVVKLDTVGAIQWQRCLGGTASDIGQAVATAPDGGFIVAGYTTSKDDEVSGQHGGTDGWVVKLAPELAPCMQIGVTGKTRFCSGSSTTLTAGVSGGVAPYTYQWKQNSVNVGTTSNTLSVTAAGTYTVEVTDSKSCKITSAGIAVTKIDAPPTPTIAASNSALNAGSSVVLQTSVSADFSLQWLVNNNPIAGATQATYTASQGGSYTVRAMNRDSCSATSLPFTLNLITALEEQDFGNDIAITVSPNPSSGSFVIRLTNQRIQPIPVQVLIRDMRGRTIVQKQLKLNKLQEEPLDLSQQATGLYLLSILTETGLTQLKLVKQ
ncbi:T9SS type A sorting domain-containing protein [Spirosoma endbachense]|uniref:T9SS type A sorting domain-containing protein n=1 Tax=Spirosoma endbachense TaxID=2666025 RepID=A0A6P1W2J0_9BACT|nr:T9SS type A sorting domain-containing protein [Spirosoma endbachense]QHV97896.1 T9SS type A sorting domain-containing protein [Spirosoma endbachense]